MTKIFVKEVGNQEEQQEMDRDTTKREEVRRENMSGAGEGGEFENVESGDYLAEPLPAYSSHGSPVTHGRREGERPYYPEHDFIHSGSPLPEHGEGSGTQGRGVLSQLGSALRSGTNDLRYRVRPPPPVLIAVMGKTGTGKTSFVNAITEGRLKVGHGLASCTQDIQTATATINDREVWLIDTPGFDDTNRSDVDILATIANWVQQANHERKHLSGIIYFHRIADTRMEGSSMKNLRMFQKLCGEKNFGNVILCTTMWDKVDEEEGRRREQELESKETFWGSLISRGAQVMQHRGPDLAASARKIVGPLIQKETIVLQLQEELDQNGSLSDTSAGRLLTSAIEDIKKKHQEEMAALKAEMQANSDKEEIELLREYYKKEIEGLRKATEELEKLRAEDMKRFSQKLDEMQRQWDNRSKCIIC